jgi:hypothetical protein
MTIRSRLIEVLSEQGTLASSNLERALRLQQEEGGTLVDILIRERLMDEDDLFFLMSRGLGLPAIPEERLLHLTLSPEIRRRVPRALAEKCLLVPVDLDAAKGLLSVALFDPTADGALEELRRRARATEIRAYLARRSTVQAAIQRAYPEEPTAGESEPLVEEPQGAPPALLDQPKVQIDPSLQVEIATISESPSTVRANDGRPDPSRAIRSDRPPILARQGIQAPPAAGRSVRKNLFPESVYIEGAKTQVRAVQGRSLLREVKDDEELTNPFGTRIDVRRSRTDLDGDPDDDAAEDGEATPPITVVRRIPNLLEEGQRQEQDALFCELLSAVGILIAMLEERIDPSISGYRELGQLCRLVAREMGQEELVVSRVALAAHLYGLDIALRREVGVAIPLDVTVAFAPKATAPGGLGPTLRLLGARALGITEEEPDPLGVAIIRLVADYLELNVESAEEHPPLDAVALLLRTGGGDPHLVDALVRAVAIYGGPPRPATPGED